MLTQQSGSKEDRLSLWKGFRDSIKELDTDQQIEEVAKFFSKTPISSRNVDFYTPSSWPTPWEILHTGDFCFSSISLLMYYSLDLLDTFDRDLQIWLIDTTEDRFIVPVVDSKFILNYEFGKISTIQDSTTVVEKFSNGDIAHFS